MKASDPRFSGIEGITWVGTNYYLDLKVCEHCGRGGDRIHIGKSSVGWVFALHVYPDRGIRDLEDYLPLFEAEGSKITDEYGKPVTAWEMRCNIMARARIVDKAKSSEAKIKLGIYGDPKYDFESEGWYAHNHAVKGPMGLARGAMVTDRHGPTKHGAGTWDCYEGQEDSW